jgi:hypothetical protein
MCVTVEAIASGKTPVIHLLPHVSSDVIVFLAQEE